MFASLIPRRESRRRQMTSFAPRFEQLESRILLALNPTAMEQEMLEHINRLRMFPQEELDVLFTDVDLLESSDPDVTRSVEYFDVDSAALQLEMAALVPAPPLAWHESLCDSAEFHVDWMINEDGQSHQFPGEPDLAERIDNAGYANWSNAAENIYGYAKSVFHGHAGFIVDWGVPDLNHRINSMNPTYNEIGISIVPESNEATEVGPLVITEDFGRRWDDGNPNVLGVVFNDVNLNGRYDAGEQIPNLGIEISGTGGTFNTSTMTAGGYQVQVPAGTYTVTISSPDMVSPRFVDGVVVGQDNVKVDFDLAIDLDFDANGKADALSDGLMVLRYLFGFSGTALTQNALGAGATRTDPAELTSLLAKSRSSLLDVDQNGTADALSDGLLILRHLFGFNEDALTENALGSGATRTEPSQITAFLNGFTPVQPMPQYDILLETIALDSLRARSAQANQFLERLCRNQILECDDLSPLSLSIPFS